MNNRRRVLIVAAMLTLVGCAAKERIVEKTVYVDKPVIVEKVVPPGSDEWFRKMGAKRDAPSYEATGAEWGKQMLSWTRNRGNVIKDRFVYYLLLGTLPPENEKIDFSDTDVLGKTTKNSYYFRIHTNLKRAFQRGFQTGFVHRNAE